ncbi:MAG TPA: hypothetical protein VK864_06525 [Longimicrobiales bacterium]|nr:hypothetical protein [Longimicrobiales bacterium]
MDMITAIQAASASSLALLALGVFHGINPGMGWLFAVALGIQERRGRAVWRALGPLALGHALAVLVMLSIAAAAGIVVPPGPLQWGVGMLLLSLGSYRLIRCKHPRWGGMRVGARDLTIWSFLMASAHGAGLMVLPFALGMRGGSVQAHEHGAHAAHVAQAIDGTASGLMPALISTLVHTGGYLAVTALLAWIVYRFVGVGILRRAWINLDLVWAAALIVTGIVAIGLS